MAPSALLKLLHLRSELATFLLQLFDGGVIVLTESTASGVIVLPLARLTLCACLCGPVSGCIGR